MENTNYFRIFLCTLFSMTCNLRAAEQENTLRSDSDAKSAELSHSKGLAAKNPLDSRRVRMHP
jgi:hypothetical protein